MGVEVHRYRAALERLWSRGMLTDKQWAMLVAHCRAGTMTAKELGREVGYKWQAVNNQYGRLGKILGEELGYAFRRDELKSSVVAHFTWRANGIDTKWHMHDNLRQAIREFAPEHGFEPC